MVSQKPKRLVLSTQDIEQYKELCFKFGSLVDSFEQMNYLRGLGMTCFESLSRNVPGNSPELNQLQMFLVFYLEQEKVYLDQIRSAIACIEKELKQIPHRRFTNLR